jgi:hypothetical protein
MLQPLLMHLDICLLHARLWFWLSIQKLQRTPRATRCNKMQQNATFLAFFTDVAPALSAVEGLPKEPRTK